MIAIRASLFLDLMRSLLVIAFLVIGVSVHAASVAIDWKRVEDRRWPGSEFWANRLQDWSVVGGKLQCAYEYGGNDWRTAHLLTHDFNATGDHFEAELSFSATADGHAGILLGGGEGKLNYKQASMIQGVPGLGGGFLVDFAFSKNSLCVRDFGSDAEIKIPAPLKETQLRNRVDTDTPLRLKIIGSRRNAETFSLVATLVANGNVLATVQADVPTDRLIGNVAIVSMGGTQQAPHQFFGVKLSGNRVSEHLERAYGPIGGVLYSVANGDLKIGVQCMSIGQTIDAGESFGNGWRCGVQVEKRQPDGSWQSVTRPVGFSEPDYYALLRVKEHDRSKPADFRVVMLNGPEDAQPYMFHVPAEPNSGELVIGGVSCTGDIGRMGLGDKSKLKPDESYIGIWSQANQWAPFSGITQPLIERKPDIVFFTGDQIYEWWPTRIDVTDAMPDEDYLYKWMIWHWSFQAVCSKFPCLIQTDDHDVWHPNLWGDGSRLMTEGWDRGGGFIKSSYFVNMVQRTMCGHNPDAYSPGPNDSGITNYFCTFTYGGVDFALLEDRKFKSALPSVHAGMEPKMLGDAQLRMLAEWVDMPNKAPARVVVSQTNYVTINTIANGNMRADRDSNGWPKTARDKAVELFDKAGAFLFTGDQHLASVTRMDTMASKMGVFQFCQPAGGCIWWRWFYPNDEQHIGSGPLAGKPSYIGHFTDAFGNTFETLAVANPGSPQEMRVHTNPPKHILTGKQRAAGIGTRYRIHQGEGFGIVHVDADNDRMTLECWPDKNATMLTPYRQFDGWPIQLKLSEMQRR
ncbi:PhoD-like phosphatase [Planctomycetes bacterium CA13]|uniref:PhoD-like phosphatase n=1 Tax=Novipirellula herctigrandis TaxID=2527986 RepID=A0A5C5ZE42_9BACT|nr:PhoD-like phosphatase [Planctomycetes bacterium CA13]